MPADIDFLMISKWLAIATVAFGGLAVIAFIASWGIRFRLVGITGFMGVLTGGVFALGLSPIFPTVVPGAVSYSTVYDSGATQAVIAVSPTISESELEATLKQAASNLFSSGRLGNRGDKLMIRARAVVHPEEGVSQPLLLGEIKRSLITRDDEQMEITLYPERLMPEQLMSSPAEDSEAM
ncbi:MAG: Ycf51 family protein [Leptolyngbyaceae bacterium]|nr:Ycf51 family protein [Leptolyngbyaceae bacterium]